MENSAWRSRARLVAMADMIYCSVEMISCFLFRCVLEVVLQVSYDSIKNFPNIRRDKLDTAFSSVSTTLWISILIGIIFGAIRLFAAIKLFHASKVCAPAREALKSTKLWRYIVIVDLIISIPVAIFIFPLVIMINCFFLYVVTEYLKELQDLIDQNPTIRKM